MKVIETVLDTRTNEPRECDWGVVTTDLGIVQTVAAIISHQRDRDNGDVQAFQGRLKTLSIRIEL